MELTVTN